MYTNTIKFIAGILLSALFFSNNFVLFTLAYIFTFLGMILYTLLTKNTIKSKVFLSAIYLMVMVFQLVHNTLVTFSENNNIFNSITGRMIGIIFVLVPFFINKIFSENKNKNFYLPSVQDITVLTFNEIVENINKIKEVIEKGRESLSKENINELLKDVPRHDSFRYINKGSLTNEYFDLAYQTMDDKNIYIVISNTGSPAVESINNSLETVNDIDEYLKTLKQLLLNDNVEHETEDELMNYYILIITQILEYIKTKDNKYIYKCSETILDIIRTIMAHEYYKENEDEMELYCYFDMVLEPEVNKQKEIIKTIRTANEKQLEEYLNKNKIEKKEIIKILYDEI
jgi:hypothetical protein